MIGLLFPVVVGGAMAVGAVAGAAVATSAAAGSAAAMAVAERRRAAYLRHKEVERAPRSVLEGARIQAREAQALARLVYWRGRAAMHDDCRLSGELEERPVLCVHGYTQAGSNFWGIRHALAERGRPTRAISMGLPFRRIERYAPRVEAMMRELLAQSPDGGLDVVAHSMGGIVLRILLARHADLAAGIRRIVTLGSPHRGTAATRGLPWIPEVLDLGRGSVLLARLPTFRESAPHAEVTTVAGGDDALVYPTETAHLPGTRAVDLPGVGHAGLLVAPGAIEAVVEALMRPTPRLLTASG